MPTYQILLHTTDVRIELEGDSNPCIGFYTNRRAKARTSEEAFKKIMDEFDTDPQILDIFQAAYDHGLRPKTEIEEVYIIPWWKALLPWSPPGLCFYSADDENDPPKQQESEQADSGNRHSAGA